jgi:hypothetical protein
VSGATVRLSLREVTAVGDDKVICARLFEELPDSRTRQHEHALAGKSVSDEHVMSLGVDPRFVQIVHFFLLPAV